MKTFAVFYEAKRALGVSAKVKRLPKGVERLPDGTYKGVRYKRLIYALDPKLKIKHRIDGPASSWPSYEEWYLNGQRHRVDGPAIDTPWYKAWYLNGRLHRIDGPAIVSVITKEWWVEGAQLTEEDYNNLMKRLSTLTDDSDREATIAAATMFD